MTDAESSRVVNRQGYVGAAEPGRQSMGRYRAVATLGQGGMANVYLALMSGPARFNKLLVLKVLREDLEANRDELAAMFLDEARLAAGLQHRNIVQTYEFGEIRGRYYMTMEYLEGKTLRELQRKVSTLPLHEELFILAETARGLHYAHELTNLQGEPLSVVHRDVSPQNVFITYDGQVKLLDFGIAKSDGAEHLTQIGVIKGKIDYIAPEQVRGDPLDRRADVFSLGAMLWEAITGERFGGGLKVAQITKFHNRLSGREPKVRQLKPDIPDALGAIVEEALALDPRERMPSAAVFAERIEAYLASLPERPGEESLSAIMIEAFREERTKLRKIVEQRCKEILNNPASGESGLDLASAAAGGLDLSAPGTGSSKREHLLQSQSTATRSGAHAPKGRAPAVAALFGLAVAVGALFALQGGAEQTQAAQDLHAAAAPAQPDVLPGSPKTPEPAPAAAASSQGLPAPDESSVTLALEVSPPDALALLDGVALPGLPFSGKFQKGNILHRLEVSAEGYAPVERFIRFDRDQELDIQLDRLPPPQTRPRVRRATPRIDEPEAPQPPAPAPPPPTAHARPSEPTPGSPLKTHPQTRKFDMHDPYAD